MVFADNMISVFNNTNVLKGRLKRRREAMKKSGLKINEAKK